MRLVLLSALVLACGALSDAPPAGGDEARGVLRVATAVRGGPHSNITPLVYWGGFQAKTAVYEPLARVGDEGRLEPALLSSWTVSPDGRTYVLRVREGVVCHDGATLDANDVRDHLVRWRGNPGNRWLGTTERLEDVTVTGPLELRVTLTEPWCFLEEASIVNPGHVVGSGAYDHEGAFRRAVGTGPYVLEEVRVGECFRLVPHERWWQGRPGLSALEFRSLPSGESESDAGLEMLRNGTADVVVDGEGPRISRDALAGVLAEGRYRVHRGPGSATLFLLLNTERGPFADVELRRRLASVVDRHELVDVAELGWADPATTLFRGGWAGWPAKGRTASPSASASTDPRDVTLLLVRTASPRMRRHAERLCAMAARTDVNLRIEEVADGDALRDRLEKGTWDAVLRSTHGAPYDPWVMLQVLFLDRPAGRTAARSSAVWRDEALRAAIHDAFATTDSARRSAAFAAVQARLDDAVPLIPLVTPHRVAVSVPGVEGLSVGPNGYDVGLGRARSSLAAKVASAPPLESTTAPSTEQAGAAPTDPKDGDVPLPADGGWNASLVLDNAKVGVWAVRSFRLSEGRGCPDVIALDDRGRCIVLTSYSGRWTPTVTTEDGAWLGGLDAADVDPRVPRDEVYVGGKNGNLFQVVVHPDGVVDRRRVASFPGSSVNILTAGDLDPARPGAEVLCFLWPGALALVTPTGKDGSFETRWVRDDPARVRDAVLLPPAQAERPTLAVATRNGRLELLRLSGDGVERTLVHREAMGMGRVAARPTAPGDPLVLYTGLDDGRVLRHERAGTGAWTTETIYLGPQGVRGIAAGRFDEDASVETVAVFGYSGRVEVLARRDRWTSRTIFRDVDKGHWLSACELDGRNATDELLASGYGGRVVLLALPPGTGRPELAGAAR
jgi:nickel transport system substrate-binding protein